MAPKLKCPVFDPSSLVGDKLAYKIFLVQFENCVLGMHDKALKLLILKNHLRGHALKIVSHLSISAESFDIALEILSSEYLDEGYMVEQIFLTIDAAKPARDHHYSSIRDFLLRLNLCFVFHFRWTSWKMAHRATATLAMCWYTSCQHILKRKFLEL